MRFHRLVGLAVLLGLAGEVQFTRAQSIAPKYLAPDTQVVATINVQQILNSEVAKTHKDLVQQGRFLLENKLTDFGVSKYLEKAGLDLFRDIRSITVAGPGTQDVDKGVLIVEGKFNPEKLKAAATDAATDNPGAINVIKLGEQTVFEIPEPNGKTVYVGTVGKDVLLATASKEAFSATVAQLKSGKAPALSKGFNTLLQTTNDKQSLSIAATGPALARLAQNAPGGAGAGIAEQFKSVDGLSVAVTLSKDVLFQVGINATDKEAAEQLAKLGNGFLIPIRGMIAQKAKEDPKFVPVGEVAQTLRIVNQGNNVVLRGEITFETLGKLLKNLPQQQGK
jgi:hypothetical protein